MVKTTQTASYPTAIVTQTEIGLFTNEEGQTLIADALIGDTTVEVSDSSGFETDMWLYAQARDGILLMQVTAVDNDQDVVTVSRPKDGTVDVDLRDGDRIYAAVPALALNKIRVELIATQTKLGTGATTGTEGGVLFADASGNFAQDATNLFWDDTANALGIGGQPATSTILDLTSTTGAVRLPRMTTTQRDALTPLAGMQIWNTSTTQMERYDGSAWDSLSGGDVSKVGTPVDNQLGVWTGDGTIEGDDSVTWDAPNFLLLGDGALSPVYRAQGASATSTQQPQIMLLRSRGSIASSTTVAADDSLGLFSFRGHDGTGFITAAAIEGLVDGTPGTNDMPGRIVFSTTADGASAATERMRISSNGIVSITKTEATAQALDLYNNTSTDGHYSAIRFQYSATNPSFQSEMRFIAESNVSDHSAIAFATRRSSVTAEKVRITSEGNVGIGTPSPDSSGFGAPTGVLHLQGGGQTFFNCDADTGGLAFNIWSENDVWKYYAGYHAGTNYWVLASTDSDGAGADADIIRIPDGQLTVDFNATADDNAFDWVCNDCYANHTAYVTACRDCGGSVDWHDDAAFLDNLVHTPRETMGPEMKAKAARLGLMRQHEDGQWFVGHTAMLYNFSAIAQLRRQVKYLEEKLEMAYTPEVRTTG